MAKKNKLVSVKLLANKESIIDISPTQPTFFFKVKGMVEGQKMIFEGNMKIIGVKKVEFSFEELPVSLDNWFNECQKALTEAVVDKISRQASN